MDSCLAPLPVVCMGPHVHISRSIRYLAVYVCQQPLTRPWNIHIDAQTSRRPGLSRPLAAFLRSPPTNATPPPLATPRFIAIKMRFLFIPSSEGGRCPGRCELSRADTRRATSFSPGLEPAVRFLRSLIPV